MPLPDFVAGPLNDLSREREQQTGEPSRPRDLLFTGRAKGGSIDRRALYRRYKRAQTVAGVDESLDFHSLRHSFVTFGVVAYGFDLAMVYAGHNDLKTQMRYRHIRSRREDAAKMEALMADRGLMTAMPTVPLMPRPAGAEGERNANPSSPRPTSRPSCASCTQASHRGRSPPSSGCPPAT